MPFWFKRHLNQEILAFRIDSERGTFQKTEPPSFQKDDNFVSSLQIEPGLYRLVCPDEQWSRQVLVPDTNNAFRSLIFLMPCFCRGNRDDRMSFRKKLKAINNRKLSLTCGPVSLFVKRFAEVHLPTLKTRLVHTLTLQPHNSYNNGHSLLEVWNEEANHWVVIDFNRGCLYESKHGTAVSAYEKVKSGGKKRDCLNPISADVSFFDFFEEWMRTPGGEEEYDHRLFDLLILQSNNSLITDCKDPRVRSLYPNILIESGEMFKKRCESCEI